MRGVEFATKKVGTCGDNVLVLLLLSCCLGVGAPSGPVGGVVIR